MANQYKDPDYQKKYYAKMKAENGEQYKRRLERGNERERRRYWDVKMGRLKEHAVKIGRLKATDEIVEYLKDNFNMKRK